MQTKDLIGRSLLMAYDSGMSIEELLVQEQDGDSKTISFNYEKVERAKAVLVAWKNLINLTFIKLVAFQINISNFRSVSSGEDSQTLNLAPLTIVCGENSSGKSTLLNSILFLKQVLEDDSISSRGKTEVDLNGPLIQLGDIRI